MTAATRQITAMSTAHKSAPASRKTRRPRAIQACNLCRAKKYKCDGNLPCSHCRRHRTECIFQGAEYSGSRYSIAYAKQLERRLEAAEAALRTRGVFLGENLEAQSLGGHGERRQKIPNITETPGIDQLPTPETCFAPQPNEPVDNSPFDGAGSQSGEISEGGSEVMDINHATHAFEFHGSTSSMAFLERLRKMKDTDPDISAGIQPPQNAECHPRFPGRSLVSDLHNDNFVDQSESPFASIEGLDEDFYPLQAYTFLDSYFNNHHSIHPILDKDHFLGRCHALWRGPPEESSRSFKALYFSLLSLGALTRTWIEEKINGMGRYEWTRLLFRKAELALGRPCSLQNLASIQAQFILAKVCQYQLDLNMAYTYLGLAIRTALSAGINRITVFRMKDFPQDSPTLVVSRTWWGLYSLEIELSFALGRPDTLGSDIYHNRPPPGMGDSEIGIIRATVDLSNLIREVTSGVYLSRLKLADRLVKAKRLERSLNEWLAQLPTKIRPTSGGDMLGSGSIRDPQWPKLQMLVLKIRYLHIMTVLFHPFFQYTSKIPAGQTPPPELIEAAEKCMESAMTMIKIIHETYRMHYAIRTWWYNTIYVTFGMSVLLFYVARHPFPPRQDINYLECVEQSLEVLAAMEECNVAQKIGNFAREMVEALRTHEDTTGVPENGQQEIIPHGPDLLTAFPQISGIFPDYVNEFDESGDFNFFDPMFSSLDTAAWDAGGLENTSGSVHHNMPG